MVKGFSESEVKNDKPIKDLEKEKKGLASFLKGKKLRFPRKEFLHSQQENYLRIEFKANILLAYFVLN